MGHEMTATDSAVFANTAAWHGLGRVIPRTFSAAEGLRLAGLDWDVVQWPMESIAPDGTRHPNTTHVENRRSDNWELLGTVTAGYDPSHNRMLAELADGLSSTGGVRCETIGSIRGGKRVYFLLHAGTLELGQDLTEKYLMLCTGHDGTLAVHAVPTSVRVVCSNTLHMALRGDRAAWTFKHSGDITKKLSELQGALDYFARTGQKFDDAARALAARTLTRDELRDFFARVYQAGEKKTITPNPTTDEERKQNEKAAAVVAQWLNTYQQDSSRQGYAGGSAWLALNAVTRWYDHGRNYRAAAEDKPDARTYARLWGTGADAKATALDMALALV